MRAIFHLSLPVEDLEQASAFYVGTLGARIGRRKDSWLDVLLWGHQITLQERPQDVLPPERQGKRHFGVVLSWDDWETLAQRLEAQGCAFYRAPQVLHAGSPDEQAKLYLSDPSHNVIEVKAYRDVRGVLGLDEIGKA